MIRAAVLSLLFLIPQGTEKGTSPCRPLRAASDPTLAKILETYVCPEAEFSWELKSVRQTEKFERFDLRFPSAVKGEIEENNTVHAKYWRPLGDGRRFPAVVLLHWLGGSFDVFELIGARFAENGIAALFLYMPHYGPRRAKDKDKREDMITLSMEKTLANFRQAVLDVRRAGDWLASRPEIEKSRIGILGISLGAIVGSLVAGVDLNFNRSAFIIGGGDLPGIVLHESKETHEIKAELEKNGVTAEKLRELWKGIEPLTFAPRIDPQGVIMMNAESDEVIPKECTLKLHEALGRPRITWFKGGHTAVALMVGPMIKACVEHFASRPRYAAAADPVLSADVPRIRVLIAEAQESLSVEIKGAFHAFKPKTEVELAARDRLARTAVRVEGGKIVAGALTFEGSVLLVPEESGALYVAGLAYHGSLLLLPTKEGRIHAINVLDLERYVMGVIGSEIGKDAPFEAQKAQAVCARAYAWFGARDKKDQLFDVYADVRDQVYKGVAPKGTWIEKAAEDTRGQVLTYKGKPFRAYFFSTCGGVTENVFEWRQDPEIEPLAGGVKCGECREAKYYSWTVTLSADEIAKAFRAKLGGGGVKDVSVKSLTKTGRAKEIAITKTSGAEVVVPATEFRATLGYDKFRSTRFAMKREPTAFVFTGHGWGHGVGLCQEGAIGMARAGKSCADILIRYYPGSAVETLYK